VPAVLCQLGQHVQIHPAKWERATPVAVNGLLQLQTRGRPL
jgi:hypothetical protein